MMHLSEYYMMSNKIHKAKEALIGARIARQLATVEREFDMYFGDTSTPEEKAQVLLDEAKALRLEAQELLREVEKTNGERYLAGKVTFPLKNYLVGKFFKAWNEFDVQYAKLGAPFFGADIE